MITRHLNDGDVINIRNGEDWLVTMEFVHKPGETPFVRFFQKQRIYIEKEGDKKNGNFNSSMLNRNSVRNGSNDVLHEPKQPIYADENIGNKRTTSIIYKRTKTAYSPGSGGSDHNGY